MEIRSSYHAIPFEKKLRFIPFSIEQGLSQSVVECMLHDRFGFLWVGTQDGLNRFDGYEFQVYRYDPNDPDGISDNYVQTLLEDRSGNLWIGTNTGGLNHFNRKTGKFTRYQYQPETLTV
jgi:ligand-binding sensor domain-containing protein